MHFLSVLALAVGLSMDATAVAAARGMTARQVRFQHVLLVAVLFGGFQALMPLLGYGLGTWIGPLVAAWDHWIIFVLLGGIGAKMIHESRQPDDGETPRETSDEELFRLRTMLVLAVATSIDAFAAGITLPMMNVPVVVAVVTIGVTTAVLSGLGLVVGRRFGAVLGRRLDALGGVMLILIGTKTLIEHLRAG